MKLQVQEHAHLVRDTESNAILNVDNRALHAYKKRKQHMSKIDQLEHQVQNMEQKMDQILSLLQQTINSK